ncbi:MAG: DMT family transporter, partial [Cyanobacteria bacterium REEB67]|nr:DMT family transporter [Cyanobacteria bacterium REEB67]
AIAPGEIKWLLPAVLAGGVLAPVAMMSGLALSAAAEASMLLNLEGVFTAAIAWFVFKENFDRRILIGMVAILLGGSLLSVSGGGAANLSSGATMPWFGLQPGALLIVLACLLWAIDNNFCKKVATSDPVAVAMIKGLTAGAVNLCLALFLGQKIPAAPLCALALLTGFFAYGLSLVAYIAAQRRLGTARTGAYFASAPFVGALLAFVIAPEPLRLNFVVAGCLMAIGLWLHLSEDHEHEHEHVYMAHSHRHTHTVGPQGEIISGPASFSSPADLSSKNSGTVPGDIHHLHSHDDPQSMVALDASGAHEHFHVHERLRHSHKHYPDIHHEHTH